MPQYNLIHLLAINEIEILKKIFVKISELKLYVIYHTSLNLSLIVMYLDFP